MNKIIKLGKEGREKLIKGINTLADAVVATLGPNGRNAIYVENGEVRSTKDGVTVAKQIKVEDFFEDAGVQLIKQTAIKTATAAGDGTTTSTLLAKELIEAGNIYLSSDKKINAVEVRKGIQEATKKIINFIKDNIKKDITSETQIKQIATVSANNDSEVGQLVATAINKVGREGVVYIEESKTGDTNLEVVEGLQFDRGYKSHMFVTNNNTMTCTLENPAILITDKKFNQVKDLLPLLDYSASSNKPLLIICDDIDGEALAVLIVNKLRGTLKVCAVKSPEFGDRKKLALEDIAILTGGIVVSGEKGMKLDEFDKEWLGSSRVVTVNKDETTIIDGKGADENIKTRIEELKQQIELSNDGGYEKEKLQERLAKFIGGVAIINVGGYTEAEIKEKKDRVEDALQATKAAIAEGIVPGGGMALLYAQEKMKKPLAYENLGESVGWDIVCKACQQPFKQILKNAGYDNEEIYSITNDFIKSPNNYWMGYNIKEQKSVDMLKTGIIDPFKVTRVALENAASVAGTVLLTEAVIVEKPEQKENNDSGNTNGLF